jgi:hypothetical protein
MQQCTEQQHWFDYGAEMGRVVAKCAFGRIHKLDQSARSIGQLYSVNNEIHLSETRHRWAV